MPNLKHLCLRYLFWLLGARAVYLAFVYLLDFDPGLGVLVALVTVPALDIGATAIRRAGRVPPLPGWFRLLGAMYLIYLLIESVVILVVSPALLADVFRGGLAAALVFLGWGATLPMMALFLWIGARQEMDRAM